MSITKRIEADEAAEQSAHCLKCSKREGWLDLLHCSECGATYCANCATELEWELQSCADHLYSAFIAIRNTYRESVRRAQTALSNVRRAA